VPSINRKVIEELRALEAAGSPGLLRELIETFFKEADAQVAQLNAALADRNGAVVQKTSQALKGSSANLGAQALSRMCAELHERIRSSDWTQAADLLSRLESEWRDVRSELQAEKDGRRN
jgi:HPt (histidine-containing phosphotransfer) domain-containing protein